jgi:hypothetical protein
MSKKHPQRCYRATGEAFPTAAGRGLYSPPPPQDPKVKGQKATQEAPEAGTSSSPEVFLTYD